MAEEKKPETTTAAEPQVKTTPRGSAVAFEIPVEKKPAEGTEAAVKQRLENAPPSPRKSKEALDQEHQEAEARRLAQLEEVKAKAANEVEKAEKKKEAHEAHEKATEGVPDPKITKTTERAVAFDVETGKRPGSSSPTKHRLENAPPSPRKTKEDIDRESSEAEKRRQAELAAVKAKAADEVDRAKEVAKEKEKEKKPAEPAAAVPPALAQSSKQTEDTPIVPKEQKPLDQLIAEDEKHKKPAAPKSPEKKTAASKPRAPPTKTPVKAPAKSTSTTTKSLAKTSPAAKKTPEKKTPEKKPAATKPAATKPAAKKTPEKK